MKINGTLERVNLIGRKKTSVIREGYYALKGIKPAKKPKKALL